MTTPTHGPDRASVEVAHLVEVATPHGPFSALVDADGAVLASGWTDDVPGLLALVHPALRPEVVEADDGGTAAARDAVVAFHDGDPGPAAAVAVRQRGGEFTERVWELMREIGAGAPVTYGELAAARAGRSQCAPSASPARATPRRCSSRATGCSAAAGA